MTEHKIELPDEIYVCGVGYKGKEGLSAIACPNTYSHQTKYVRADLHPAKAVPGDKKI